MGVLFGGWGSVGSLLDHIVAGSHQRRYKEEDKVWEDFVTPKWQVFTHVPLLLVLFLAIFDQDSYL